MCKLVQSEMIRETIMFLSIRFREKIKESASGSAHEEWQAIKGHEASNKEAGQGL